jgi:hypothetical protein
MVRSEEMVESVEINGNQMKSLNQFKSDDIVEPLDLR